MQFIKSRPLVATSLLAIFANALLYGTNFGGNDRHDYPAWVPIGAIAIVSLPALLNLALGLLRQPERATAFAAIASIPSFFGVAIYLLVHNSTDGQTGLTGLVLLVLQVLSVPVFWGLAGFVANRGSGYA